MGDSDDYPSWKEALFGNGHAANLYCAVKYAFWHATHALLAVLLLAVFVIVKVAVTVGRAINAVTPDSTPSAPRPGLMDRLSGPRAKAFARGSVAFAFIGSVVYCISMLVYFIITAPLAVAAAFGLVVLIIGVVILWFAVKDRVFSALKRSGGAAANATGKAVKRGSEIRQKSEKKPLVRRLLGYCPVSMNLNPKWFDRLEQRLQFEEDK
jgi:hypothetical protein